MLGETPEQEARRERAEFMTWLFASPWTTPAVREHEGYATDRFHWLIDRMTPPPELPGIGRALERLAWYLHRCFALIQAQRARLST